MSATESLPGHLGFGGGHGIAELLESRIGFNRLVLLLLKLLRGLLEEGGLRFGKRGLGLRERFTVGSSGGLKLFDPVNHCANGSGGFGKLRQAFDDLRENGGNRGTVKHSVFDASDHAAAEFTCGWGERIAGTAQNFGEKE